MTIHDACSQINLLKPSRFEHNDFIRWLSQVESMVKRLIMDTYEGGDETPFTQFDRDTDMDTTLFMPAPFDMAYIYYLEAQIHYYNEDIDMYNSAIMMFNSVFNEFKAYYGRNHTSRGTGRFRF